MSWYCKMSEEIPVSSDSPGREGSKGWVKFEDGDGGATPAGHHHSVNSSSGVSSARGSVNSVKSSPLHSGAELPVTDIQVVDEANLRRQASVPVSTSTGHGPLSSNPNPAGTGNNNTSSVSMDNVNLSDVSSNATTAVIDDQAGLNRHTRGRQFVNGDPIVTMLPVNEKLPWIWPARFRPELVPEELMNPSLTLTVEEYVQTMEKLTSDMRFIMHNIFYKRILVIWITVAFLVLLAVIGYQPGGAALFGSGVAWLILNALAIFLCMWIKLKLNKKLEKCLAFVNSSLLKHNIILGVDDRGKLSCQKVNLCFIYLESASCIKKIEAILEEATPPPAPESQQQNGGPKNFLEKTRDQFFGNQNGFDRDTYLRTVEEFEDVEVVVPGRGSVSKISRRHERAEKLFLHYIQRWAKDYLRRRLDWVMEDMYGRQEYASNSNPRHIRSALCPCQYIEEHLRNKRQRESLNPCAVSANPCHWCD